MGKQIHCAPQLMSCNYYVCEFVFGKPQRLAFMLLIAGMISEVKLVLVAMAEFINC